MKCTICGTELRDDAKFCKACGSQVKREKVVLEKINDSVSGNKVNEQSKDIFKMILEQLQHLEKNYLDTEAELIKAKEENGSLKTQLLEKVELLEKQEQKYQKTQKLVEDLQHKLSDAEKEIEKLNAQIVLSLDNKSAGEKQENVSLTCPKCHALVDENTIFCGECGTKIQ